MKLVGNIWKSEKDTIWLVEIPSLDLMTQARSKKEVPGMVKDAVELLADDPKFSVKVTMLED